MLLFILLRNFNYIFILFILFKIMCFICNLMKPSSKYRIVLPALTLRIFILPQCVVILRVSTVVAVRLHNGHELRILKGRNWLTCMYNYMNFIRQACPALLVGSVSIHVTFVEGRMHWDRLTFHHCCIIVFIVIPRLSERRKREAYWHETKPLLVLDFPIFHSLKGYSYLNYLKEVCAGCPALPRLLRARQLLSLLFEVGTEVQIIFFVKFILQSVLASVDCCCVVTSLRNDTVL